MVTDFAHQFEKSLCSRELTSLIIESAVVASVKQQKSIYIEKHSRKRGYVSFEFDGSKALKASTIINALCKSAEAKVDFSVSKMLEKTSSDKKKLLTLAKLLGRAAIVVHDASSMSRRLMLWLQKLSFALQDYSNAKLKLVFIDDDSLIARGEGAGIRFDAVNIEMNGFSNKRKKEIFHQISVDIKLERRGVERFFYEEAQLIEGSPNLKLFLAESRD